MPPFSTDDFITLQPGKLIRQKTFIALENYGITSPGSYQVKVWYHSPIQKSFAPTEINAWTSDDDTLMADPIIFEIIK